MFFDEAAVPSPPPLPPAPVDALSLPDSPNSLAPIVPRRVVPRELGRTSNSPARAWLFAGSHPPDPSATSLVPSRGSRICQPLFHATPLLVPTRIDPCPRHSHDSG